MKVVIFLAAYFLFANANAETTIWDELPASQNGRFEYFKKNDSLGVFEAYREMHGKKYIFACVNAVVFHLFAYQDDSIENSEVAKKNAERKCAETFQIPKSEFRFPYGTPIFLRFEIDKNPEKKIKRQLEKMA